MLHQFLVVFICFTVALCVSADDNTNLSTPYIKPIQQYVTIVVVPNIMITESWTINPLNGHDTVNFDGAFYNRDNNNHNQLPVVVHVPLDQTEFCEFHNDVFHSEPLQKLCKDFVGSKFPAIMNDPESSVQYDSDEVFFFASISSGKIVDSTKFLLPLTDELHGKQMIIQFYGNWSVLSANEAQALVIDIAGRRELQTYVGAPVRKPRYTSLVVSDTRATQLESPTIVYLPPERTDICFRLKHLFPTAVLMDLCVDAADSIFTFPSVRYDVNEIFLFISNDSSSIESFNQISWPIMDPELGTIFVQCFGQWTDTDAAPVVDFMTNLYRNKQLQTYTGGPPHAPTRIFTLVLSETIQGQFDPTEYMIIKVPNNQTLRKTYCHDYCNPNSSLVLKPNLSINSTIEQQCNKITEMLRFVPHPVMELNQHVKLNEVFIFMNNEVSLSELLQFGFVVGESIPVERVSFVQVFGKWGHNNSISSNSSGSSTTVSTTLEPEMAKAIIMENNLLNYTATDVSVSATDVL